MPGLVPRLSDEALTAYLSLLAGPIGVIDTSPMGELLQAGMVVPSTGESEPYTALSPRHVERIVRERILDFITGAALELRALQDLIGNLEASFLDRQSAAAATESGGSELLVGAQIDAALEELLYVAREEVLTAQPGGPRPAPVVAASGMRDFAAMRRGIKFRTLYNASARHTGAGGAFARQAAEDGSQVRTTSIPFMRCIIFDDDVAVIPAREVRNAEGQLQAWLVRDRGALDFARTDFELTWQLATPWNSHDLSETVTTGRQRAILRGLLAGNSQAQVARSLMITESWASKTIKELMTKLGLQNQPQLIAWWCESEERHVEG